MKMKLKITLHAINWIAWIIAWIIAWHSTS
jgi:hypothetical protein